MKIMKKSHHTIRNIVIALFISVFAFGSIAPVSVFAADGSTTVYTTKTGKCYHSVNCSSLSKSKNATTLEDAINHGYAPCSKCKPPKLDVSAASTSKSTIKKASPSSDQLVWKSATGSCYHSINNCGRMNPNKAKQITESEAKAMGLTKCNNCW